MRRSEMQRKTKETDIALSFAIDGTGKFGLTTGIGFFDHMLSAFTIHGGFDLAGKVIGDLQVDEHHTVEDVGIVLGKAFREALGEPSGIKRFGNFYVPMDEALGFAAVDVSGRPFLVYDADMDCRDLNLQLYEEFFRAFAMNAQITIHLKACYGKNGHHIAETLFKAFSHALSEAVSVSGKAGFLSTKGLI